MASIINTNIPSLNAQRNLNASQNSLSTALQRLSSGLRVNSAKDDAAGLAIATRMNAQARGMTVEITDPVVGPVRQVGIGTKFSATPGELRSTAPHQGEHTDDVLEGLGYSAEQIAELRAAGTVA